MKIMSWGFPRRHGGSQKLIIHFEMGFSMIFPKASSELGDTPMTSGKPQVENVARCPGVFPTKKKRRDRSS